MKKKIVTIQVELQPNQFQCDGCGTIENKSMYAIAQATMGVSITFTCKCSHKTILEN